MVTTEQSLSTMENYWESVLGQLVFNVVLSVLIWFSGIFKSRY